MKKLILVSLLAFILIGCHAENMNQEKAAEPDDTTVIVEEEIKRVIEFASVEVDLDNPLDEEVLDRLSDDELALLRNAYYAKYGYDFKNEENKTYFNKLAWYTSTDDFDESSLTDDDLKAIDIIVKYEKGGGHPVEAIKMGDLEFVFYLNEKDDLREYDNVLVFNKDHQVIFELADEIEEYYGELVAIEVEGNIERKYFILSERAFASSFPNKLILEYMGGELKIACHDDFEIVEWADYNDDGQLDFFAMIAGGGQTSLDEGFGEIFIYDNDRFISSKRATRDYYYDQVERLMAVYKEDNSYENFDRVCRAKAFTGHDFDFFLSENSNMYSHLDDKDIDVFMTNYALKGPVMAKEYNARWEYYWYYIEEQPFEVPEAHKTAYFDLMFMDDLSIEAVLDYFGGDFDVIGRTFYTEYIKDDIRIEFSKDHPIRVEFDGMYGFHLSVNKAMEYEDGYILVYAIGVDDYMTFLDAKKNIETTHSVQGIVYDTLQVDDGLITFDRTLESNDIERLTFEYESGRLTAIE